MKTNHKIHFEDARELDEEVELVVTSPPYPMVEMWDEPFSELGVDINQREVHTTFMEMHRILDGVWKMLRDSVVQGGIVCINVGDSTRNFGGQFRRFPNAARITQKMANYGFTPLPSIIWKKTTNSPSSFMGSGMSPPNQYVTSENEYILIFRKGGKLRNPQSRHEASYFFEERNEWFSGVWSIGGAEQHGNAQFPFEIPFRLINMYSTYGDTVLDPFWGTGTTTRAAIASARNSIGYELDEELLDMFYDKLDFKQLSEVQRHRIMVHDKVSDGSYKYESNVGLVKTKEQRDMRLFQPLSSNFGGDETCFEVSHKDLEYDHDGDLLDTERYD